jgi:quinol-cytochrome oxidoreductase complex cytochrome b subunit
MKTITLIPLTRKDEEHYMQLLFKPDEQLTQIVKKIPKARWSETYKCWYFSINPRNFYAIINAFDGVASLNTEAIDHFVKEKNYELTDFHLKEFIIAFCCFLLITVLCYLTQLNTDSVKNPVDNVFTQGLSRIFAVMRFPMHYIFKGKLTTWNTYILSYVVNCLFLAIVTERLIALLRPKMRLRISKV